MTEQLSYARECPGAPAAAAWLRASDLMVGLECTVVTGIDDIARARRSRIGTTWPISRKVGFEYRKHALGNTKLNE